MTQLVVLVFSLAGDEILEFSCPHYVSQEHLFFK